MKPSEIMFEATVRTENLIWIPGVIGDELAYPEVFEDEFCENMPEGEEHPLYAQLPVLKQFMNAGPGEISEALRFTPGFLIQAATPVMRYAADGASATFSWGEYYTCWLYARTEGDIAPVCAAWATQKNESDRAKALAKARAKAPA